MKSYDELTAEIGAIQHQVVEVEKNELADALKEVKWLSTGFGFAASIHRGSHTEGWKKS